MPPVISEDSGEGLSVGEEGVSSPPPLEAPRPARPASMPSPDTVHHGEALSATSSNGVSTFSFSVKIASLCSKGTATGLPKASAFRALRSCP